MFLHSTAVCSQLPPEFQNLWIIQAEIQFPQKFQNIEIPTRYIIYLTEIAAARLERLVACVAVVFASIMRHAAPSEGSGEEPPVLLSPHALAVCLPSFSRLGKRKRK